MTRRWLLPAACGLLVAAGPSAWPSAQEIGVLVLAHGGSAQWNRTVERTVAEANLGSPTEIAFGMGMHPEEVEGFQAAVDRLQGRGVSRIVIVPLLVSSTSEVMRQFQYLFGLRDHGSWETGVKPLARRVPIAMAGALDDDPLVAEVLLERALELSRTPEREAVILVAHGPTAEEDNARWLDAMGRLAERIRQQGRFRLVIPVTLRDDAPKPVRDQATRAMRELVQQQAEEGAVLVVPLLLAGGGIEGKIPQRLRGLHYLYRGRTLLPDPRLSRWLAEQVRVACLPSPGDRQAQVVEPSERAVASPGH